METEVDEGGRRSRELDEVGARDRFMVCHRLCVSQVRRQAAWQGISRYPVLLTFLKANFTFHLRPDWRTPVLQIANINPRARNPLSRMRAREIDGQQAKYSQANSLFALKGYVFQTATKLSG